jgi:type VI secretion system protein VasG
MAVNLKSLIGKLNNTCRQALEGAAGLCVSQTNYNVELEHWFVKLLEIPNTDLSRLCRHFEINVDNLSSDFTRGIDQLKRGSARSPALSPNIPELIQQAWMVTSVELEAPRVRSGALVLGMLSGDSLSRMAKEMSKEFGKISVDVLRENLRDIITGSVEDEEEARAAVADVSARPEAGARPGKTPALDQYTINLTERAKNEEIDPVLGRDFEIRQIIDILTRRRQNNPILTGEAGVGKTAVVEGFALRITQGDVPPPLQNVALRTLDLGLLQAGAGVKGEFENRLKSVISEVKASPQPVILFIDEAHTMIGAGGQAGSGDAANLLKPALARGELRTIAATTWSEYKKYFEKDAALARRFQVVKVEEPTEEVAIEMMRGLGGTLEKHHKVRILDEAVEDSVRLSHRYLSGRHLPDKSVSVLDTACARVALGHSATPPAIEDCRRKISSLGVEIDVLQREQATGMEHGDRIQELIKEREEAEVRLEELNKRLENEKELIDQLTEIRGKLEEQAASGDGSLPPDEVERLKSEFAGLRDKLLEIQGDTPLMEPYVDSQAVAAVISGWTGIPVGKMVKDEIKAVLSLRDRMEERIIGQPHALEAIGQRVRTSRANLDDPRRPIGVFMLVGPSGVGKTETAVVLADLLYGGEHNMVTINMSEYQEAHTVSSLKGSPPGYVGYGEGGVLTEAVRRKPYCVVLLDEVEKAHPDVMELFYQVFDKGSLEDGEGRQIDFKNTLILLTSNAGTDIFMELCKDPEDLPEPDILTEAIRPGLLRHFKPALLGRMAVVPYYPLGDEVMRMIIRLQLGKIGKRMAENQQMTFSYDDSVMEEIAGRCTEVESGARNVDHILTRTLLPEIAQEVLAHMAEGEAISKVHVAVGEEGAFKYEIS